MGRLAAEGVAVAAAGTRSAFGFSPSALLAEGAAAALRQSQSETVWAWQALCLARRGLLRALTDFIRRESRNPVPHK
jgi:hypothetical protein